MWESNRQFKSDGNSKITADKIKRVDVQNIVDGKYKIILKELELNNDEIKLLEDRLLSPEGYRWPLYLDIALSYSPSIREEKLADLQDKKILKRYSIDGRRVIEIIHDKYALAVKSERDFRLKVEQEQLQVLKDQEELTRKKIEDDLKFAEEKARLDKHKIEEQLKLAEQNYLLDKKKSEQEKLHTQKEIKYLEEEKALAQEKLEVKNKSQKRILVAGLIVLVSAIIAFFLFFETKKQKNLADAQTKLAERRSDSLILERDRIKILYSSLRDTTLLLSVAEHQLHTNNDSLRQNNSTLNQLRKKAEDNYLQAITQERKAKIERRRAENTATYLALQRDITARLNDSLRDHVYSDPSWPPILIYLDHLIRWCWPPLEGFFFNDIPAMLTTMEENRFWHSGDVDHPLGSFL